MLCMLHSNSKFYKVFGSWEIMPPPSKPLGKFQSFPASLNSKLCSKYTLRIGVAYDPHFIANIWQSICWICISCLEGHFSISLVSLWLRMSIFTIFTNWLSPIWTTSGPSFPTLIYTNFRHTISILCMVLECILLTQESMKRQLHMRLQEEQRGN